MKSQLMRARYLSVLIGTSANENCFTSTFTMIFIHFRWCKTPSTRVTSSQTKYDATANTASLDLWKISPGTFATLWPLEVLAEIRGMLIVVACIQHTYQSLLLHPNHVLSRYKYIQGKDFLDAARAHTISYLHTTYICKHHTEEQSSRWGEPLDLTRRISNTSSTSNNQNIQTTPLSHAIQTFRTNQIIQSIQQSTGENNPCKFIISHKLTMQSTQTIQTIQKPN